jgi:predicted nucleic acid-binding protein
MMQMDELSKKLKRIQKEIDEFQEKCKHENQQIKFDEKNNARWFCDLCHKNIRIPNPKELEDWIKR